MRLRMMWYVAVLAAALFGVLAVISVVVLLTNGALAGEEGTTGGDVSVTVFSIAVTVVAVVVAMACRKRLRRR
jgi:hypothetical protein